MALLAGVHYDPTTAVTKATTALLAMTALDTTNLRLTFTAPSNGAVLVRMRGTVHGASTMPTVLFGVLSGSTVMARQAPVGAVGGTAAATTFNTQEALMLITGLTPGGSYTFDAAYGVEIILASTGIKYGGPNGSTANDAFGGLVFEIYDTPNLLGGINYDPSTAVSLSTATAIGLTAMDTTNLRITFTAPSSGKVLVRLRGVVHGATTFPQILLGVLSGSTVMGRDTPIGGLKTTAVATAQLAREAEFLVTGLTSGTNYTFDAAYGVETVVASTGLKYGGPNNTTTNDAFGGFSFDIWSV